MGENCGDGDLVGDWYLFGRLLRTGDERLPKPLVALAGYPGDMRDTQVVLTAFGEAVLGGRESNYPTNPIEDEVAGERLPDASGQLWVRDGDKIVRL